jgi:hypothetical protein
MEHPWNLLHSSEANIKSQEQFSVGRCERVYFDNDKTGNFYVDAKITNPQAKAYIKSFTDRKMPMFVSPQIIHNSQEGQPFKEWSFTHLAIVSSPAYNRDDAKILHACNGTYDSCSKQFENIAVASASSCNSVPDSPDPAYPYFPAPTAYHAALNKIVDDAVAVARSLGMGIAVASYEPDESESKSESKSANASRLRRIYPESEIPSSFREKLRIPANGKRPRKLV